jgi:predicted DCC family thiol-disulfide oxidoreductase YuxK
MNTMATANPIVLFDGVCNLCNGSVQFILRHDPSGRFRFASLQSSVGQDLLARFGMAPGRLDSVVLVEGDRWFRESDAALRIARGMSGGWKALAVFRVIPRPIRDAAYRFIARNRYRWFGKQETCWLSTPELRGRFLG